MTRSSDYGTTIVRRHMEEVLFRWAVTNRYFSVPGRLRLEQSVAALSNTVPLRRHCNRQDSPGTTVSCWPRTNSALFRTNDYRKGAVKPSPFMAGDIRRILRSKTDFACIR